MEQREQMRHLMVKELPYTLLIESSFLQDNFLVRLSTKAFAAKNNEKWTLQEEDDRFIFTCEFWHQSTLSPFSFSAQAFFCSFALYYKNGQVKVHLEREGKNERAVLIINAVFGILSCFMSLPLFDVIK